ncbi:MAG: hypothetical protein ACOYM3_14580, partial [Terrimicrobiaceae bacterium]
MKYETGSNTGLPPQKILTGSPFSFPRPRPAVSFDAVPFVAPPAQVATLPYREVVVRFQEEAGVGREAGVRFGFPLSKGT